MNDCRIDTEELVLAGCCCCNCKYRLPILTIPHTDETEEHVCLPPILNGQTTKGVYANSSHGICELWEAKS